MKRKTIEVETTKDWANAIMAAEDSSFLSLVEARSYRLGIASLLEQVLHRTGNYKGYIHTGKGILNNNGQWVITDDSRRRYI